MYRLKHEKKIRSVFFFICSIIAVLAINCKMECVTGAEASPILNGIYKLYSSFYTYNFLDILAIVAVYILINYVDKQNANFDKWTAAFSVLLSISYVVSGSYEKYDSAVFLLENSYQMLLSGMCITGYYIILYYIIL